MQFRPVRPRREPACWIVWLALLMAVCLASTGCGEKKRTQVKLPPPPPIAVTTVPKPAEPIPPAPPVPLAKTSEAGTVDADRNRQLVRGRAWRPKNGQRRAVRRHGADGGASHPAVPVGSAGNEPENKPSGHRPHQRSRTVRGRARHRPLADGGQGAGHVAAGLGHGQTGSAAHSGGHRQRRKVVRADRRLPPARWRSRPEEDPCRPLSARHACWTSLEPPDIGCACACRTTTVLLAQRVASNIKVSEGSVFLVRLD